MPTLRHGWTIPESIDLRIAAIQYLRAIQRRESIPTFLTRWWDYWRDTYGVPNPGNWDEVNNYRDHVEDYRRVGRYTSHLIFDANLPEIVQRVFRTIRWHALSGSLDHTSSSARARRIQRLRRDLLVDLADHHRNGTVFSVRQGPPQLETLFEDSIRGFSLLDLGPRERQ